MNEEEQEKREDQIELMAQEVEEREAEEAEKPVESDVEQSSEVEDEPETEDTVDEFQESEEVEETGPEDLEEEKQVQQEYPDYLNLKIDGEIVKVESSKVWDQGIRSLQKEVASDRRLELAEESRRKADKAMKRAEHYAEAIKPSPEQAKIIRDIATNFETQFGDLAGDERLKSLVIQETDKLLSEGNKNNWETYQRAAKSVKQWHEGMLGVKKTEQEWQAKREKKAKAASATVKGVNAKTTTSVKKAAPEPTTSDIISEMRAARGQA